MQMKLFVFISWLVATCPTTVVAWPNEFLPGDIQAGYVAGLAPEVQGIWLGDEKYKNDDEAIENYCTEAIVHAEGYLTWESVPTTCKEAGVSAKNKLVIGNWFEKIEFPAYIYRFRQKTCLPTNMCEDDITTDSDPTDQVKFKGWKVLATN
jgi:hypothetical protein